MAQAMVEQGGEGRGRFWRAAALAAAIPVALFFLAILRLGFDAPVWDDYTTVLGSSIRLQDAQGAKAVVKELIAQHNEHRITVTRLLNVASLALFGELDIRFITLTGHLFLVGIFALFVREFGDRVPPTAYFAAAALFFQLSYWETSLMAMATSGNFGVVFFAFLCLAAANGEDRRSFVICLAAGVAAALSQANGLAALPLAAAWHVFTGRRQSAAVLAAVFLAVAAVYFRGYVHPAHHPSAMLALERPVAALSLFFINLGGVVPGLWLPGVVGLLVAAGVAWAVAGPMRREHPVVMLWMAFVLASLASATAGRVGFGVFHSSRYAINGSVLLAVLLLGFWATTVRRDRGAGRFLAVLAVAASLGIYWMNWPPASDRSQKGKMLAELRPGSTSFEAPRFAGIQMLPVNVPRASAILGTAVDRGLYRPPANHLVFEPEVRVGKLPPMERSFGIIDAVEVEGTRMSVTGWTDVGAELPGRVLEMFSEPKPVSARANQVVPREDVGILLGRPTGILGGFRMQIEYATAEDARAAAPTICLMFHAPNRPRTLLWRPDVNCGARAGA